MDPRLLLAGPNTEPSEVEGSWPMRWTASLMIAPTRGTLERPVGTSRGEPVSDEAELVGRGWQGGWQGVGARLGARLGTWLGTGVP